LVFIFGTIKYFVCLISFLAVDKANLLTPIVIFEDWVSVIHAHNNWHP